MQVNVLLFAQLRELSAAQSIVLTLEPSVTGSALKRAAAEALASAGGAGTTALVERSMLAVDNEYVMDLTQPLGLGAGSEVALIPPISGG